MNTKATNSSDPALRELGASLPILKPSTRMFIRIPNSPCRNSYRGFGDGTVRAAGYEVTTGVGKTGVVGLLRNGEVRR